MENERMDFADLLNQVEDGTSKLPYPMPEVPHYVPGRYGLWEISEFTPPMLRGYYRGLQLCQHTNYLLKRKGPKGPKVWMSLTPMELESHMPHIAAAKGTVVVGGLGMGMYLYNILQKPDVHEVFVYEMDKRVVNLMAKQGMGHWPGALKKLTIIEANMLSIPVDERVVGDHLYVDIWQDLGSMRARKDMVTIASQITAKSHSWWGMELDFIDWAVMELNRGAADPVQLNDGNAHTMAKAWADAAEAHGINIHAIVDQEGWATLALKAAHNVTLY